MMTKRTLSEDTLKRFWEKVDVKDIDECWNWTASKLNKGYGGFWDGYRANRAHRISWEIVNGAIPKGKLILHHCDNPLCVNPNHLYCGTHSDNVGDRELRNPGTAGNPKLYKGEIWLIRKLKLQRPLNPYGRRQYKFSASFVAKMFKVSSITIHRIWDSSKYLCKEGYYI